jgi:hypothetical protein
MQTLFRMFVINVGELALRLMLLNAIFKRSAVASVYRRTGGADDARPFVDLGFEMPVELLTRPADRHQAIADHEKDKDV